MSENKTTFKSTQQRQRALGFAAGVTLLVFAGVACGSKSESSSPVKAPAVPLQESPVGSASPVAPGAASRTSPSPEQVAAVIVQVKERIPMTFQPNDGHVRAFADAACSAFDEGKTAPQVENLVLLAASQLPSIKVSAGDAEFAVRTAVTLFCPGYTAKLGS